MPVVHGIDLNHTIQRDGDRTVLLVNGLADDLATWDPQWGELARSHGVPFVMRDVTPWTLTLDVFRTRGAELAEFEAGMAELDQSLDAYLAQLAVIQDFDTTAELADQDVPTLVLAGAQGTLIPTAPSHELHTLVPGSSWRTTPGGHACLWEHPDAFDATLLEFLASH